MLPGELREERRLNRRTDPENFLAQPRAYHLKRRKTTTFQSVILAGVYDVRSIKRKSRPEENHKANSPWNIAAEYTVDMDFGTEEIAARRK